MRNELNPMKIILMRHGRPAWNDAAWRSSQAMQQWCEEYDRADIADGPPERSIQLAAGADYLVTSTLPRAQSSLARLGRPPHHADTLYREVSLPVMPLRFPALPPALWLPLLRGMWLCGYAGRVESLLEAQQRADRAAAELIRLTQHGDVLLMGHGIMNKLIARQLRRRGWLGEKHASSRYWSSAVYNPPLI